MSIRILSVNVAQPSVLLENARGRVVSSIDKVPVSTPTLWLSETNLAGDRQSDIRPTPAGGQVHGGPHQAVYAFPHEHYPRLSEIVGRPVTYGFMGENLTLSGLTETGVCIGDIWEWGEARLQVSAPRGPCFKLGIRMGRQAMRQVVREEGLVGWYLRVLRTGTVPTSGTIEVVETDPMGLSVSALNAAINDRHNVYREMAAHPALAPNQATALRVRDRDITGGVPEVDG